MISNLIVTHAHAIPNAPDGPDADALVTPRHANCRAMRVVCSLPSPTCCRPAACTPRSAPTRCARILPRRAPTDEPVLKRALRDLRKRVMLRVIARDLGGLATLDEVVATVTALADIAIASRGRAISTRWLAAEYGDADREGQRHARKSCTWSAWASSAAASSTSLPTSIWSSSIPKKAKRAARAPLSNHEFFTALARRLIALLNEMTADGYVFRVDMRLRPFGDDGPLVVQLRHAGKLLHHAGPRMGALRLDQGARAMRRPRARADRAGAAVRVPPPSRLQRVRIDARLCTAQVRREVERRDILDNIKLGPGGIREIEFIVQLFQLIRGGRDAALREPPTLDGAAAARERATFCRDAAVQELTDAYVFLRNLEHRLQYLDDKQTHDAAATTTKTATLIAAAMGCRDYAALLRAARSASRQRHAAFRRHLRAHRAG